MFVGGIIPFVSRGGAVIGRDLDYEAEYLLYRLGLSLRMTRSQVIKGHLVDALALRGDEGRSTLR